MDEQDYTLSLPEAGLEVSGSELRRLTDDGKVTMRIDLKDIQRIEKSKRMSPFGIVIIGAACAIGYIAVGVADANSVRVMLLVIAVLLGGFGLLGLIENVIIFHVGGQKISIPTTDEEDLVTGFIASLSGVKSM